MAVATITHPASSNQKLIFAAQIAFLPTGILTTVLGPMLPLLMVRWELNDAQAGNLFVVQFLSSLLGVQLSGILLSKFGFRPAFFSGLLLMACGAAMLYTSSLWLGMACVAVYGLGIGLFIPTDNLLIAEIASDSRASAVSVLNLYFGVGAILCALLVAWTAAHHLLPFFLGSVSLVLVLLAVGMRGLPFPAAAPVASNQSVRWRVVVKHPTFWVCAAVFFLYMGVETGVSGWIGSYVSRLGSHDALMAPMMPAFFWAALAIGRALGTFFLPRVSERFVLRAGYAAGSAGIILLLCASSVLGVIIGTTITGLSLATLYPMAIARLSQRFGVAARGIGAVMFSLASVGQAVVGKMVGVTSQATGSLRAGLLLPLGASVILFLIHLRDW